MAAVLARPGTPILVPPGDEAGFLAPHPSGLLTPDPDVRARLTRFGLRRIGAVAELDRTALVARFGEEGARIHARAHGVELEPFRPRRAPERLVLGLPIEPAAEDLEPIRFVLHRLAGALTGQLVARGLAASRARLHLDLDLAFALAGTPTVLDVEQRFPEPTADTEAIERLLFARLERTPPPAAIARLVLELDGTEPAAGQQLPLFTPQAARARPARLAARAAGPDLRGGSGPAGGRHRSRGAAAGDALGVATGRLGRTGSGLVTRLLREHPAIEVELDAEGILVAIALERPARAGRGLQPLAGGGGLVARVRSPATTSRSSAVAGWRSSTSIGSTGRGISNVCTTETLTGRPARLVSERANPASA